jgi:hypothetical protein
MARMPSPTVLENPELSGVAVIIDAHKPIYPDSVAEKALNRVISNMNGRLDTFTDGIFNGLLTSMDRAGIHTSIIVPQKVGVRSRQQPLMGRGTQKPYR